MFLQGFFPLWMRTVEPKGWSAAGTTAHPFRWHLLRSPFFCLLIDMKVALWLNCVCSPPEFRFRHLVKLNRSAWGEPQNTSDHAFKRQPGKFSIETHATQAWLPANKPDLQTSQEPKGLLWHLAATYLAAGCLNPVNYEVSPPWIRLVCPVHPTGAQLDSDLGRFPGEHFKLIIPKAFLYITLLQRPQHPNKVSIMMMFVQCVCDHCRQEHPLESTPTIIVHKVGFGQCTYRKSNKVCGHVAALLWCGVHRVINLLPGFQVPAVTYYTPLFSLCKC